MKTCPSCGTDVPSAAARCKECFHDFTAVKKRSAAPVLFLGLLATMAIIGALTLGIIVSWPTDQKILVEEESHSIVFIRKYRTGERTERIPFSEIAALEHVIEQNGEYKSVALRMDGSRIMLSKSKKSLKGDTERNARVMDKPWTEVDNTTGFFSQESVRKLQTDQNGGK
jgi:hypothetical protein